MLGSPEWDWISPNLFQKVLGKNHELHTECLTAGPSLSQSTFVQFYSTCIIQRPCSALELLHQGNVKRLGQGAGRNSKWTQRPLKGWRSQQGRRRSQIQPVRSISAPGLGGFLLQPGASGIRLHSITSPSYIYTGTINRETQILFPGVKTFKCFQLPPSPTLTRCKWVLFSPISTTYCVFFLLAFCCCRFNSTIHHEVSRNLSRLSPLFHGRGLKKSSPCRAPSSHRRCFCMALLCFRPLPDGQRDRITTEKQKQNPAHTICFSICARQLFKSAPAERFGAGARISLDN